MKAGQAINEFLDKLGIPQGYFRGPALILALAALGAFVLWKVYRR